MTEEQKQALINRCKNRIAFYKAAGNTGTFDADTLQLTEIALAALTAQPVKLPHKIERDDADGYWMHKSGRVSAANAAYFNEALSECKEALKAQGYEVQE